MGKLGSPKADRGGDYGTVDKETEQFEKDGDIYEDVTTAHLAVRHRPEMGHPENELIISSKGPKYHELEAGANIGVTGLADASIKGRWEFGTSRGALLIIAQPHITYIHPKVLLKQLVDVPALRDKSLVTDVISCPAYSLYLSNANKDTIDVALVGAFPAPIAPAVTAGGEIRAARWAREASGVFRSACASSGSLSYTPLYNLKKIRRKGFLRRDGPVLDPGDDDLWVDTPEPWDPLDDGGEEEVFDDSFFD